MTCNVLALIVERHGRSSFFLSFVRWLVPSGSLAHARFSHWTIGPYLLRFFTTRLRYCALQPTSPTCLNAKKPSLSFQMVNGLCSQFSRLWDLARIKKLYSCIKKGMEGGGGWCQELALVYVITLHYIVPSIILLTPSISWRNELRVKRRKPKTTMATTTGTRKLNSSWFVAIHQASSSN